MTEPFLFILALVGGIASFLSPCNVVVLPTFISYLGSQVNDIKKGLFMSLVFSIGFCLTFGLISTLFIFISGFIRFTFWFQIFSGITIIVLSFYVFFLKFFKKSSVSNEKSIKTNISTNETTELEGDPEQDEIESKYQGYSGSFFLGFSLSYAWIGCNVPIYITIIIVVSNQASFLLGIALFFIFALGIMIPFIIIGTFIGMIRKKILVQLIKVGSKIQKIFAVVMLYIGIEILLSAYGILGLIPFI